MKPGLKAAVVVVVLGLAVLVVLLWFESEGGRKGETDRPAAGADPRAFIEEEPEDPALDPERIPEAPIATRPAPAGAEAERVRAILADYLAAKRIGPEAFGGDRKAATEERRRRIAEALAALIALGDGAADAILGQLRAEGGAVERCFLARGLGAIDGERAAKACAALLGEVGGLDRKELTAMISRGRTARTAGVFREAIAAPGIDAEGRRLYFAHAAGPADAGSPRWAGEFLGREPDPAVRTTACVVLRSSGDARFAPALEERSRSDADPALRRQALGACVAVDPAGAPARLRAAILEEGRDRELREAAVDLAAGVASAEARALLEETAKSHPDADLRTRARAALVRAKARAAGAKKR